MCRSLLASYGIMELMLMEFLFRILEGMYCVPLNLAQSNTEINRIRSLLLNNVRRNSVMRIVLSEMH